MHFAGINYFAVGAAAVASYAFGAIYYTALSKPWIHAVGKTETQIRNGSSRAVFVISALAQVVMAGAVAGVMGHFGADAMTAKYGLITGICLWIGFVATTLVVNHGFEGARRMLTVIDGAHWLGVLCIQGALIGLIGL